jgi:hypothetical protein
MYGARSGLVLLVFNRASTYNLCYRWWPCFMVLGSVRSIPTMFANNQCHIYTLVLP